VSEKILEVEHLSVVFGRGKKAFKAVDDVSFSLEKGENFGIVGESGSGKTTIGRTIMRICRAAEGSVKFKGEVISGKVSNKNDKKLTDQIQMIFQDPMSSLNERAKVGYIVSEGLYRDKTLSRAAREDRAAKALIEVGLRTELASRFPHEFSGGQRQRIGIARAMVMEPELIIADEPISALDMSIRAQVLNVMNRLKREHALTMIFISHDLSVTRFICDRIACLHKGVLVEMADTETLYSNPLHPYTQSLLSAVPQPDPRAEKKKKLIAYDASMHDYTVDKPIWCEIAPGHFVRGSEKELEKYRGTLL
jgi:oligopeptide transport system ATP-binding protein